MLATKVPSSKVEVNRSPRKDEGKTNRTTKPASNSIVSLAAIYGSTTKPTPSQAEDTRRTAPSTLVNRSTASIPTASIHRSEGVNQNKRKDKYARPGERTTKDTRKSAPDSVVNRATAYRPATSSPSSKVGDTRKPTPNAVANRPMISASTARSPPSKAGVNQVQRPEERETGNTRKPTSNSVVNRATAYSSTTSPSPGHAGGSRESTPNAPVNQTTTSVPTASIPSSREGVNVTQRREKHARRREEGDKVTRKSASDSIKRYTADGPTARVLSRKKKIEHLKDQCTCASTIPCTVCKINTSYVYLRKKCV